MVDAARDELPECRLAHHRQQTDERDRGRSGDAPRDCRSPRHRGQQPEHRPDRADQTFRKSSVGELVENQVHAGEPGIDQA